MPYTYRKDKDGTDETFDIISPTGEHLASVPYWEDRERAEAKARLIVDTLNAMPIPKPTVSLEELSHALNAIDGEGDISEHAEATEFLQENSIAIARQLKEMMEAK